MSSNIIPLYSERDTAALAARVAAGAGVGDVYYLSGPVGAGKTTFTQYFLRALGYMEPVTSPTYTLMQQHQTPVLPVVHVDCYRLEDPSEAAELGLEELQEKAVLLIEWPEQADGYLPGATMHIRLNQEGEGHAAQLSCPFKPAPRRLPPVLPSGVDHSMLTPIPGDASFRRYYRVQDGEASSILMYAPPPESLQPFLQVGKWLQEGGLTVPQILQQDEVNHTLLLEDFGDVSFTKYAAKGDDEKWAAYQLAYQALNTLWGQPAPAGLAPYDMEALIDEVSLYPLWAGEPLALESWQVCWRKILANVARVQDVLVLRDYHTDNLMLVAGKTGVESCGLLDFQDALAGHPAYDLVSLLQDARRDVPAAIVENILEQAASSAPEPKAFKTAYYILGAQRHFKVIGIFNRLAKRDGKDIYLEHLPRLWRLVEHCLAMEPALQPLAEQFPEIKVAA